MLRSPALITDLAPVWRNLPREAVQDSKRWESGPMEVSYGLLAGRAPVGQRELPRQRDDLAPVPKRCRFQSSQRVEPLGLTALPQVKLGAHEMRFDAPRVLHRFDALVIGPAFVFSWAATWATGRRAAPSNTMAEKVGPHWKPGRMCANIERTPCD